MSAPDGCHSWVIAVACCFINALLYGMARLSGVLFVASIPRFGVSREQAAFPYTFCTFVRNTSGPLVGYLGHRFGVRSVTTFGCLLGAIGIGFCYFAQNITTVTILWGTVFGLGFGLGNILLPVAINQYFDKYRATASGISFSGACLGSFILPPVVEFLLNTYGLSGTFLFLAGFVVNCVPAALLLKKPIFTTQKSGLKRSISGGTASEKQSITAGRKVKLYTLDTNAQHDREKTVFEPRASIKSHLDVVKSVNNSGSLRSLRTPALTYEERIKRLSTQTLLSDYSIRMSNSEPLDFDQIMQNSKGRRRIDLSAIEAETSSATSQMTDESEKDEVFAKESVPEKLSINSRTKMSISSSSIQNTRAISTESITSLSKISFESRLTSSCNEIYCNPAYQRDSGDLFNVNKTSSKGFYGSSTSYSPSNIESGVSDKKSSLEFFKVILDPIFLVIVVTNALYCFTFVCMITVIVDFARDVGIGQTNEKYILMSLSVGDLIGRLGLGWVTDKGYMTRTGFAALCFMCQAVATTVVAWSNGFAMLMGIVAFYGLSEAGIILIFPLIIAQYIDEDKQTVAIPSSNFLAGPLCLAVAPLIGYFRDQVGVYDYIFYGIGIISAACGVVWLLIPLVDRCRKKPDG